MENTQQVNAKLYFEAVMDVLGLYGMKAEKWLDKNSKKLSGKATTKEECIKEIIKITNGIKVVTEKETIRDKEVITYSVNGIEVCKCYRYQEWFCSMV